MPMKLHWVDGPWRGRVVLAARPRGSDWLDAEIADWQRDGVNIVVSLLTPVEEGALDLRNEARAVKAKGMKYVSLPIPDREVPASETELTGVIERLDGELASGKNVLIHCRQGIGRSGLVAACLLVSKGLAPEIAVRKASAARGVPVPETKEQREWIDHYAAVSAGSK